jgi:Rrf2 family protein
MRISAKADYAVRAMIVLADRRARHRGAVKAEEVARAAGIPPKFLETILVQLKRDGLVEAKRGADGGYWLSRPPEAISLADVLRAVDGPLTQIGGRPAEEVSYPEDVGSLAAVWRDAGAALAEVLEEATLDRVAVRSPVPDFQI